MQVIKHNDIVYHTIVDVLDVQASRTHCSDPTDTLQVNIIKLQIDTIIKPHYHTNTTYPTQNVQEMWYIAQGQVDVQLFADAALILRTVTLTTGMLLCTFRGGHSLKNKTKNTIIIECKNGPFDPQSPSHYFYVFNT